MVKNYAAYVTGALAMILTALILWCCTQLPIEGVIIAGLAVYWLVIFATLAAIDRLERRKLRRHAVQIATLVQAEMDRRRGRHRDRGDRVCAGG